MEMLHVPKVSYAIVFSGLFSRITDSQADSTSEWLHYPKTATSITPKSVRMLVTLSQIVNSNGNRLALCCWEASPMFTGIVWSTMVTVQGE